MCIGRVRQEGDRRCHRPIRAAEGCAPPFTSPLTALTLLTLRRLKGEPDGCLSVLGSMFAFVFVFCCRHGQADNKRRPNPGLGLKRH